jgi:anti-sigma factor RsiW
MRCKEFVELVTEYFEETLAADDRRRFEEHIAECFWCARYIEQMRVTIRTVGRIEEESISPEAREVLLATFRGWNGGGQPLPAPPG